MTNYEKLVNHIKEKIEELTEFSDNARRSMDTCGVNESTKKEIFRQAWRRNTNKAQALFEIIDFINNMEE